MVKKLSISLILIAVLIGATVWSYERGLSASSALEATKLMVIVQLQRDCIEKADAKCTAEANQILAASIAGQLRQSDLSILSGKDRKAVEEFIGLTELAQ